MVLSDGSIAFGMFYSRHGFPIEGAPLAEPCPFCGHGEITLRRETCGHGDSELRATCQKCGAQAGGDRTEAGAMARWNARAAG